MVMPSDHAVSYGKNLLKGQDCCIFIPKSNLTQEQLFFSVGET